MNIEALLSQAQDKFGLTDRQLEVIKEVLKGKSNLEIGWKLGIAEGGVKYHLTEIYRAMGLKSRHQLVVYFYDSKFEPEIEHEEPLPFGSQTQGE